MVKKIDDMNFYELLEISPSAGTQDVHRAYDRVRRIYDPNSIALYSLFTPEETVRIRQRIEDAYRTLVYEDSRKEYNRMLKERNELPEPEPLAPKRRPVPAASAQVQRPDRAEYRADPPQPSPLDDLVAPMTPAAAPAASATTEFNGPAIKARRENAGLTIRNVADMTKIGSRYLEYIEAEQFERLPARPYLRGFLLLYAQALGCDSERMVADYLKRYEAAKSK
jgi:flagellar biosynthesis protein FlhG